MSEERTNNSENVLKEIQTERMIYQINSSSDARETSNKMKKGLDEITNAMRSARDIAHKKKVESDELKINLYEKKDKMKKTQQALIRATKRVE